MNAERVRSLIAVDGGELSALVNDLARAAEHRADTTPAAVEEMVRLRYVHHRLDALLQNLAQASE